MNKQSANFCTDVRQKYLRCVGWAMLFCPTWLRNQRWAEQHCPTYGCKSIRQSGISLIGLLSRSHARRGNAVSACFAASHANVLCIRDARPSLHSHAARGNEGDDGVSQDVGRNKPTRRQQGWVFPALRSLGMPETPVLRLTRGQAYSGLLRDVYNDERGAWECIRGTLRLVTLRPKYPETRCRRLGTMQCA